MFRLLLPFLPIDLHTKQTGRSRSGSVRGLSKLTVLGFGTGSQTTLMNSRAVLVCVTWWLLFQAISAGQHLQAVFQGLSIGDIWRAAAPLFISLLPKHHGMTRSNTDGKAVLPLAFKQILSPCVMELSLGSSYSKTDKCNQSKTQGILCTAKSFVFLQTTS